MATTQKSVTGSITIKRLRKGGTVSLELRSDLPLIQITDGENVSPDFTQTANQPTITPTVRNGKGEVVTLQSATWSYNGVQLTFSTSVDADGWQPCTNSDYSSLFKYKSATKQMKIVGNIASADNLISDTITCTVTGESSMANFSVSGNINFQISKAGATTTSVAIYNDDTFEPDDTTLCRLGAKVYQGLNEVTGKWVKWYDEAGNVRKQGTGPYTFDVLRDYIDGWGVISCSVFEKQDDTSAVASAWLTLRDYTDEYDILLTATPDEWDGQGDVTVTAQLIRFKNDEEGTTEEVTDKSGEWKHTFLTSQKRTTIKEATTQNASITTAELATVPDEEDLVDIVTFTM